MYRKILVGFDGSAGSRRALAAAIQMARDQGSELCCLAVEEKLPAYASTIGEVEEEKERANRYFERLLEDAKKQAQAAGMALQTRIQPGYPAQTIVDCAREGGFDLIIMGHSGSSGVWGRFLGTTTEKVTRHAHCSVLVVR